MIFHHKFSFKSYENGGSLDSLVNNSFDLSLISALICFNDSNVHSSPLRQHFVIAGHVAVTELRHIPKPYSRPIHPANSIEILPEEME